MKINGPSDKRNTDRQLQPAIDALGDDFDELTTLISPWGAAVRDAGGYLRSPIQLHRAASA